MAFASAAAIHFTAIVFARNPNPSPPMVPAGDDSVEVVVSSEPNQPEIQNEDSLPDVAPLPDELFPEEQRKVVTIQPRKMIHPVPAVSSAPSGVANYSSARVSAVYAPRPDYPYQARREHLTGSGIARITVQPGTGAVVDAHMMQTTGNVLLDQSTLSAFRRWRFKPGTVTSVRIPITYNLTGASY